MRKAVTLLIAVGAVTVLSPVSFATIIHVPADQPTIQAGILSARQTSRSARLLHQQGADEDVYRPRNTLRQAQDMQGT